MKKKNILSAITTATNELLNNSDFDEAIIKTFDIVGNAIDINRIVLFKNSVDENGKPILNYKYEWISDIVYANFNNPDLRNKTQPPPPTVVETLLKKKPLIINNKEEVDPEMRAILDQNCIRSVMLFPIFLGDFFWGFIGFDDCKKERKWKKAEKDMLTSFSASIADSLEREREKEQEKISL